MLVFYLGLSLMTAATSFNGRVLPIAVAAETHEVAWQLFRSRGLLPEWARDDSLHAGLSRRPLVLAVTSAVQQTGLSWAYAFSLVRLASILLAFLVFHSYLRIWFKDDLAMLGTLFVAASMAFTFTGTDRETLTDFPELIAFTLGMACLVLRRPILFGVVVLVGTINRESTALLVIVAGFDCLLMWREGKNDVRFLAAAAIGWLLPTAALHAWLAVRPPSEVYTSRLSLLWRNLDGLKHFLERPHPYNNYLFPIYTFGLFWLLPFLGRRKLPVPLRAGLFVLPLFAVIILTIGALNEPRELAPLYPILVPASLMVLFPRENDSAGDRSAG